MDISYQATSIHELSPQIGYVCSVYFPKKKDMSPQINKHFPTQQFSNKCS